MSQKADCYNKGKAIDNMGEFKMDKKRMISDAAKELGVETHVLRYWEEELNLSIPRNEMGHRYYGEKEMKLLEQIKEHKKNGAQLKEIKALLPVETKGVLQKQEQKVIPFPKEQNDKMQQFEQVMVKIVGQALKQHEEELGYQVGQHVADRVVKEMDYHFREQEEQEEMRFQKVDMMIRDYQQARAEIAAGKEKKKRRFFSKKS